MTCEKRLVGVKIEEGKVSPFPDIQDISSRTVQKLQVCVGRPEETG